MKETTTVIVALPEVDDRVNRISSEKVPHLTMLYLGDSLNTMDVPDIVTFVQHAARNLNPFYLTVDYRDTLGDDQADVLFFEENYWMTPELKTFRHQLLQNEAIRRAYDSTEQFPDWKPHLTLGYPESPAKEDDSDYPGINGVHFDRLAVWFGDYEGPEIRLKREEHALEVSMSETTATLRGAAAVKELFHYGKQGMKWGVRNSKKSGGSAVPKERGTIKRGATKANTAFDAGAKVIAKGEKKLIFLPQKNRDKAARATQAHVLVKAAAINQSAQFKGKDLKKDPALKAEYFKQVESAAKRIYADELGIARAEAWAEFLGVQPNTTGMRITAASNRIKHAEDGQETLLELQWVLDDLGQIKDVVVPEKYLSHSEDILLAHHGVKGMRWGVTTKDRATQRTPTSATVTQKKPGKLAKAKGGANQPLHDDAVKSLIVRQQAKRSTTDSLSNHELQSAVNRMQLEQKYTQLAYASDRRSRGARFVTGLFGRRKPVKFRDMDEEVGLQTREAVKKAIALKAARAATGS